MHGSITLDTTGSVTLKVSRKGVTYGQAITLSGKASRTGTPVALELRKRGAQKWTTLGTLTSSPTGTYSRSYKPTIGAKYRALIFEGQIKSAVQGVTVMPKLRIKSSTRKTLANHKVAITSTITPGSGVLRVTLLQCNGSKGAWRRILNGKPNRSGKIVYHWKMPAGKNYFRTRVIDHNGADGYRRPTSNKIEITASGTPPKPSKHVRAC
jgi:hypothetical protein